MARTDASEQGLYKALCLDKFEDDSARATAEADRAALMNRTLRVFRETKIEGFFSQTMGPFHGRFSSRASEPEDSFEVDVDTVRDIFAYMGSVKAEIRDMVDDFLHEIAPDPGKFYRASAEIVLDGGRRVMGADFERHQRDSLERAVAGLCAKMVGRRQKIVQLFYKDILIEYNKQIALVRRNQAKLAKQLEESPTQSRSQAQRRQEIQRGMHHRLRGESERVLANWDSQNAARADRLVREKQALQNQIAELESELLKSDEAFQQKQTQNDHERDAQFQARIRQKKGEFKELADELDYLRNLNEESHRSNKALLEGFLHKRTRLWEAYRQEEKQFIHHKAVPDAKAREYRNLFQDIQNNSAILARLRENLRKMHQLRDSFRKDTPRDEPAQPEVIKFEQLLEQQTNRQLHRQINSERDRFNSLLSTKQTSRLFFGADRRARATEQLGRPVGHRGPEEKAGRPVRAALQLPHLQLAAVQSAGVISRC